MEATIFTGWSYDELRKWMEKSLRSLSAKSDTAGAIRYALSRWRALTRYTEDGLLEIDNSAAERALRAAALGRKKLPLRWIRLRWPTCRSHVHPDRFGQAQRTRSGALSANRAGTDRRSSSQPNPRSAAMEHDRIAPNPPFPGSLRHTLQVSTKKQADTS